MFACKKYNYSHLFEKTTFEHDTYYMSDKQFLAKL